MSKKIDPLAKELAAKHSELEAQRKVREKELGDLNLKRILDGIQSKAEKIEGILEATNGKGQKKIMQVVETEIIRSADGALWCPDYSFRPYTSQDINCYAGSYWIAIDAPVWKEFVFEAARRCGLPQDLKRYKAQADSVFLFIEQMCQESSSATRGDYLYNAYKDFSIFMRLEKKVGRNDFYKQLEAHGHKPVPNGNDAKMFNLKLSE